MGRDMSIKNIIINIEKESSPSRADVSALLQAEGDDLKLLFSEANQVRKANFGDDVFLRGIIEFSNYCNKNCFYCGIQEKNEKVHRYRISDEEIINTCKKIEGYGQTTVVLQSGEDFFYTKERMSKLIETIKKETSLAVTVSVGVRDKETYATWRESGMDRYLLRFETSNKELFKKCNPDDDLDERLEALNCLKSLGVQTGSGFLIGLPGQTYDELAEDIIFCTNLNLDMIGVGPFISHPDTEFSKLENPFSKEVFFKVIAILRLLNTKAHIPSTTAFDAIDKQGRNKVLQYGANVFMPNATPKKYRKDYSLYPGKPCIDESSDDCANCVTGRLKFLGRNIGVGPGHSIKSISTKS
jgi:biotin synthase